LAAAANSVKGRDAAAAAAAASSSSAGAESELYPLVYPFVQICLSVMELMPNVRFYPLRFLCARLLNTVCRATGVYVPLAPHLLPVLQMAQFEKKTRNLIKGQ
jgi:nucleolar complex protein 2